MMAIGSRTDPADPPRDRSTYRIVADLLRAAREADTRTRIVRQAGLDPAHGQRVLTFMEETGLVELDDDGWRVTDEGRGYLTDWARLEGIVVEVDETLDPR